MPYKAIIEEIKQQYLEDDRTWIIGFSGGKDSTCVLQLVFQALKQLKPEQWHKEIHVLCNDTLVENPAVVRFIDGTLDKIREAGKQFGLPVSVVKVTPTLADSFWVNLIGKGYPAPNRFFRWCTERMKINPTNAYIKEQVKDGQEAIILLGTRKAESTNRSHSMAQYERKGKVLRRHSLPGVWVYAPIADLSTDETWTYLLSVPSPWGGDNRKLWTLYRNASGGECPLVIDTTTPSCGNSRFGCWVCTVVDHDKSMIGLIDAGEDWMEPMLEFRNWLRQVRNDPEMRDKRRRNGQIGEGIMGPFSREARAEILKRLLEVQHETGQTLISTDELSGIQWVWHQDFHNAPKVDEIYRQATGHEVLVVKDETTRRREEERALLDEICLKEDVPTELVEQLIQIEKDKSNLSRRHNLYQDMEAALHNYLQRKDDKNAAIADHSS